MTRPVIAGNGSTPPAAEVGVALARARLAAELDWLRLVLAEEVERFRAGRHRSPEAFLGFTIDDAEVDHLLTEPVPAPTRPQPERGAEVRAARVRVDEAARAVGAFGHAAGLQRLASRFALDADDLVVLLLAAAPDLDDRFETLYAYLHDDIGRRRASIGLALRVLGGDLGGRWNAGRRFDRGAPLVRHGLIRIDGDGPFLSRTLAVDDRVLDELVDRTGSVDARLAGWVAVATADAALGDCVGPTLRELTGRVVLLDGRAAADAAAALSTGDGRCSLHIRLAGLTLGDGDIAEAVRLLAREAALREATVVITDGQALLPSPGQEHRAAAVRDEITRLLAAPPTPVIVVCGAGWPDGVLLDGVIAERHTVDIEPFTARRDRWAAALSRARLSPDPAELDAVAALFALSPGQIQRAVAHAARTTVVPGSLTMAARQQLAHGLGGLARRLDADVGWDDLVVSPATGRQLRELATVVRSRHLLADTHSVALRSRGLSFLFAGPSGTGKTLAASVLAAELGLDLYAIDLATVVNKYIGETEKQLRQVFSAARSSNAILFFDEADALFGKRSEVSDAHDRYANIEVAYLLQQMEAYDGVAILATNLSGNLDDAFTRRVHQVVEFAFPDAALRARLWEVMLRGAAVTDDVEVPTLAQRFELAGGNIRNCAVHARLLAAAAGTPIGQPEVMVAVAREYQKLGRHPSRTEFGDRFGDILELLGGS
ncbi:AAA family ATPase [Mycobacterium sp. PDNC021]|uniref:AAA family ATPase n=1 Tax=Mycobacterium sp. PDNC021 TaxID=3391399 RepID=UPI003AAD4A9A